MGWESSLMTWFDIGKLVEASSLLLVVESALVGFTTDRAARTLNLAGVFCVSSVVASLAGVTSVSFLPTLIVFCVVGVVASLVGFTSVSFLPSLAVFCVVSWTCVGFWPCGVSWWFVASSVSVVGTCWSTFWSFACLSVPVGVSVNVLPWPLSVLSPLVCGVDVVPSVTLSLLPPWVVILRVTSSLGLVTVSANTAWLPYSIKVVPNNTDATPTDNFRIPQRCFPSTCFCW